VFNIDDIFIDERLDDEKHLRIISDFNCGESKELEDFLKAEAFTYNRDGQGNTYLIFNKENNDIIGYYTLRTNAIQAYNEKHERIEVLPAIEVARLAISENYQRKGYGRLIFLFYILPKIHEIRSIVGVNIIMLFSVDTPQAIGFYEHLGFKATLNEVEQFINEDCNKGCKLMYVNIESIDGFLNEVKEMMNSM